MSNTSTDKMELDLLNSIREEIFTPPEAQYTRMPLVQTNELLLDVDTAKIRLSERFTEVVPYKFARAKKRTVRKPRFWFKPFYSLYLKAKGAMA